jgi:hypothetical protein
MSEEAFTRHVRDCRSWDELLNLLNRSVAPNGKPDKLAGYGTIVDAHFIRDNVDGVRKGDHNVNFITRNYGLRDKVVEFIEMDQLGLESKSNFQHRECRR